MNDDVLAIGVSWPAQRRGAVISSALLIFTLDRERYAIAADATREVIRAVAIAALPSAPPIVEGVINLRGEIVPVLDVRERFGRPATPLHPGQHFIIARAGSRTVALRVDRAEDLIAVEPAAVTSAGVVPGAKYTAGVARLSDGVLVIHDLDAFLSLDEGDALDRAIAGHARAGAAQPARPGAEQP